MNDLLKVRRLCVADNATGVIVNNYNSIDKIIQLHEEKIALYERMLKEKDDMMTRLEGLIKSK